MAKRRPRPAVPLPLLMTELAAASFETMMRRMAMMAAGSCSLAEYQRMVLEKAEAAQHSALALMLPNGTWHEMLTPWHKRARANAKRLRRRRRRK